MYDQSDSLHCTVARFASGRPNDARSRAHLSSDDSSSPDNCATANMNAGKNRCSGTYECKIAHLDFAA